MTLKAVHKLTDEFIEIQGISEIGHDTNTYYLTGKRDPRNMTVAPLTVKHDGTVLYKAYKIELDSRLYYSIGISD